MQQSDYINRELSWIRFNERVLEEARCSSNPVLERVKFLAITSSNLDEFFMVRVGSLTVVAETEPGKTDITGWTASEQLAHIRKAVTKFNDAQYECFNELEEILREQGVVRCRPDDLTEKQSTFLREFFDREILSTVAPMAIDRTDEFPMLSGARLCICVRLRRDASLQLPTNKDLDAEDSDRFLIIPLGKSLRRLVPVPADQGYTYMLVEDVIGMFLAEFFGNQIVLEWSPFRILRNADIAMDEDAAADLLSGMQQMLEARVGLGCVRLEVPNRASQEMRSFLQTAINAETDAVYPIQGPLDYSSFFALANIPGYGSLKDTPWPPQASPDFPPDCDPFEVISQSDRLLYHPYQTFDPVVDFIRYAAKDPDVIAIKQTLYRTGTKSEIAKALITAAKNGKNVTAIVELKARFDEQRNINWAKQMELAGVDVIYGVRGLKTHAKICIVVRREPWGIRRYLHIGTGNYNEATAKLYSDAGLFTCDESIGLDAVHFFNAITGLSVPQPMNKMSAAPIDLRETLLEMIRFETDNSTVGIGGEITAKMNSLVDKEIIDALYDASKQGVRVRLNIRGICCLRPGVKGLSENISVVSVIDRFLEHARIMRFRHDGDYRLFISSADWMGRNLDRRVELMMPIENKVCKARLTNILESYFKDNVKSREMLPDGRYQPIGRSEGQSPFRSQQRLFEEACEILTTQTNPRTTVFRPHRGESTRL